MVDRSCPNLTLYSTPHHVIANQEANDVCLFTICILCPGALPSPVKTIPILADGKAALKAINDSKGLGFDDWDLEFYTNMFQNILCRDPTDVECFDMAQSNSEHSRHWFFGGNMVIDGEQKKETLFSMVKATLPKESNSVIAFHDNSSAIQGFPVPYFRPTDPTSPSPMTASTQTLHPILTAETHNFPRYDCLLLASIGLSN